jgi:hypothetical protein
MCGVHKRGSESSRLVLKTLEHLGMPARFYKRFGQNIILQRKRNDKVGYAAVKLDFSKAYNSVEWNLLRI